MGKKRRVAAEDSDIVNYRKGSHDDYGTAAQRGKRGVSLAYPNGNGGKGRLHRVESGNGGLLRSKKKKKKKKFTKPYNSVVEKEERGKEGGEGGIIAQFLCRAVRRTTLANPCWCFPRNR